MIFFIYGSYIFDDININDLKPQKLVAFDLFHSVRQILSLRICWYHYELWIAHHTKLTEA